MPLKPHNLPLSSRFRGLLPVVIDVETSGINPAENALLEIAAVALCKDERHQFQVDTIYNYHVEPFIGAVFDPEALAITGIDPSYPLRYAIPEKQALHNIFTKVAKLLEVHKCQRAVIVGHNAWFDLAFIRAAMRRCGMRHSPFHSFTVFDTATLAGLVFGETVLARALQAARIPFDVKNAHSAVYDAERTAQLFCHIVNSTSLLNL